MRALILVDLQNDFLPGGALVVTGSDAVIPVANRLMPAFDLVVATKDWHPRTHGSFVTNHPGLRVGDIIELGGQSQVLWPEHCLQGEHGAAFAPGLRTDRIAHVFRKGTHPAADSYSGFFDNGREHATGLGDYLHGNGVDEVYILGLATDYCVKYTALDACRLGFVTRVIVDGCRGVELHADDTLNALGTMRAAGVKLVNSEDIVPAGQG